MKPAHLLHAAWVVSLGLALALARAQTAPAATNALPPLPVLPALTNAVGSVEPAEDGTRLASPRLPVLEPPTPIPLAPARYGGLFGQMRETERPLQLLNPLAPREYGDGTQNLSVNPSTGRGEGLTLFSIQLKPKSSAKKPKKRADSGR